MNVRHDLQIAYLENENFRLRAELAAEREAHKQTELRLLRDYHVVVARLTQQRDTLREALEPFVSGGRAPDLDDFDRARAVLRETGGEP